MSKDYITKGKVESIRDLEGSALEEYIDSYTLDEAEHGRELYVKIIKREHIRFFEELMRICSYK